jgi:hypothetical protein
MASKPRTLFQAPFSRSAKLSGQPRAGRLSAPPIYTYIIYIIRAIPRPKTFYLCKVLKTSILTDIVQKYY